MNRVLCGRVGLALVLTAGLLAGGGPASGAAPRAAAVTGGDWPAYLHNAAHSSASFGATAITPANAASLTPAWTFTLPAVGGLPDAFEASPTVSGGRVYIGGAVGGMLYALDLATGGMVWQRQLDKAGTGQCKAKAIEATATVAPAPSTGTPTVYAAGARRIYALNAATGAVQWQNTVVPQQAANTTDYYNWSSPTVANGQVYMGVSSRCDRPLVRGGVQSFSQATGALLHRYWTVPAGAIGGSVWSSVAVKGSSAWVTTGNPDPTGTAVDDTYSIVRLNASTLAKQEKWTVSLPIDADLDFGSSPTLWKATVAGVATPLVGACNKNGRFYAWRQTNLAAGPVWSMQVGAQSGTGEGHCLPSAVWDYQHVRLFVAANGTTLGATRFPGAVRSLDPATGAVRWATGLSCTPFGSPSLAAATGLVAVSTYGPCATGAVPQTYLLNAATGAIVHTLPLGGPAFPQPVFAGDLLLVGDGSGKLVAYKPAG